MAITIRRIADIAGVSRGTVDRVLNGRPGVKPEVRKRVLDISKQLNYVPNMAAKALSYSKKPVLFGIVMPPREIQFFEDVRTGLQSAAEELKDLGMRLEYRYVNNRVAGEAAEAIREFVAKGASGILFSVMDDETVRQEIANAVRYGVPVVTFNSDVEGSDRLCFVGQDLPKSGRIAAGLMNKIAEPGSDVAVVIGTKLISAHRARLQGFAAGLRQSESTLRITEVIETYDKYENTLEPLLHFLTSNPKAGGIYMAAGSARGCMDAVRQAGLVGKIGVIANDLLPEIRQGLEEGIIDFTIGQNPPQQGYRSLRILYDYVLSGKWPEREYFYTETSICTKESL